MTIKKGLSEADVQRLLSNPSAEARADTAAKLAEGFSAHGLSDSERRLAEDIFRIMMHDAEERVRRALALHLKSCPDVPRDVAVKLAHDVETVAVPMLKYSDILTDEDLVEIIQSQGTGHHVAIASRAKVSETVSEALVETKSAVVVETLVANEGADISENSLKVVIDSFGDNESVQDKLAHRAKLPITVAERLMARASENLRRYLMSRPEMTAEQADMIALQSRERAILGLAGDYDMGDVELLVRHLHRNERLTASIILRALCMGDLRFFEAGLAQLSGVPLVNTRILIHDSGRLGFRAIFERAGLPKQLFQAFFAAVEVERETRYDGAPRDRERHSRLMLERILTQYGMADVQFGAEDLEYLMTKLMKLPSPLAAEAG
ncbi:MAG: DUF2336 domain-containing protein [Alphaproteobacteria bacterium]|nr:DUF2336 domain-containing protein [Alphaproteobacteria bacterium]